MPEFKSLREKEAQIIQFKKDANKRLSLLLSLGAPLKEIASFLGAEEFLSVSFPGGRKAPVYSFDAQAFIQREINRGTFLRLPDTFIKLNETVIPPGAGEMIQTGSGQGIEKKGLIPRSRYLVELLTDLNQAYQVILGTNTENMIRSESYQIFLISNLKKIVFVNDEEGNATFVVSPGKKNDYGNYSQLTKEELKSVGEPEVQTIIYPGNIADWKTKIKVALTKKEEDFIAKPATQEPDKIIKKLIPAPDGWMTVTNLANKLGKDKETVKMLVEIYRKTHEHCLNEYLDRNGIKREFLSPVLIEEIKKKVHEQERAPSGWMHLLNIAQLTGATRQVIAKIIDKHRSENLNWCKKYYSERNRELEFYHPGLVQKVLEDLAIRGEKAPDGWQTNFALSTRLLVSFDTTLRIADKYRVSNPEWFKIYLNKQNFSSEYFHPDLSEAIADELKERSKVPDSWMTVNAIAGSLGTSARPVEKILQPYRTSHPFWFRDYQKATTNVVYEHIHPQLVKIVKKIFRKF